LSNNVFFKGRSKLRKSGDKTKMKVDYEKLDLAAHLGDIMKPSQPDFGYKETIEFKYV